MTIYERIKNRRKEIGLSADDVAVALGVSRATVYRYESSEIEKLPTSVLEPLSRVLRTSPSYLMGWEENIPSVNTVPLLTNDEEKFLIKYRHLNNEGRVKLTERADELCDLGYVQKGDVEKMA